ncbi:hypothetical protein [Cryobacterium sp. Hb1]|uniref:hypothetical protein n=1 Tax=Cryobacterium sp. Hb1 TaxID=1259147 RepID=UPI00141BDB68|nr:hypothetical protein [Cryobacterium sp. Hb1]
MVSEINIWAGFTAARKVTRDAFGRRPASLTLAHERVTILLMALIKGLFGIAAL